MTDDQTPPGSQPGQPDDQSEASMRLALERIGARKPRDARAPAPSFSATPMSRNGADGQKRRFVRDGEVPVMMVTGSRPMENASVRRGPGPQGEQLEAAQAALRTERSAHDTAERRLKDAETTIGDLRTKLGHIALARDEAIETAKRAEAARAVLAHELDTVNFRLAGEVSARARAERMAAQLSPGVPLDFADPKPVVTATPPQAPRRRGRPPKVRADAPAEPAEPGTPAPPRRRGRPPKDRSLAPMTATPTGATTTGAPKRKPGRPRIEREPEPVKWWLPKPGRGKPG